ncbi:ribonuclease H-like domain-containing protein [Tanacetum coccineum]
MRHTLKVGIVKANHKYNLHVTTSSPIPKSPFYALRDPNWKQMCDEYKALIDNNTWVLVPRPPNVNIVRSMWLYKHKYNVDGSLNRYKARLVTNGRRQQQGIECDETFSPVVKNCYLRTVLSLQFSSMGPIHQTPIDTEKKLGLEGSPVTDPTLYRSIAGSLQYLTFTRPDLSYAVQQLCLYMHDPLEPHLNVMKRVLRYLRGTTDLGLQLFRSTTSQLIAYSDADWAGCPATRRSTYGYCVFLGDNLLTWSSKRQDTLSRSSAEAEYRGVANAVAETSWIRNLLRELHTPLFTATLVERIDDPNWAVFFTQWLHLFRKVPKLVSDYYAAHSIFSVTDHVMGIFILRSLIIPTLQWILPSGVVDGYEEQCSSEMPIRLYNDIARFGLTVTGKGGPTNSSPSSQQEPSTSQNASHVDKPTDLGRVMIGIAEQGYSVLLLSFFFLEVYLTSFVPYIGKALNFLLLSWMYAYYCFEYKWNFSGLSLQKRLEFFESNWAFFAGFGSPCVLAIFFLSPLVSYGTMAVLFPLFVLTAAGSDADSIVNSLKEKWGSEELVGKLPIFYAADKLLMQILSLLPVESRGETSDKKAL